VNNESYTAEERELGLAILRYLESHPEAKDTLEGIAQWWLMQERSKRMLGDVERAAAWLCSQGLILETQRPGVPPYYQLNPQKREEISKILKGS